MSLKETALVTIRQGGWVFEILGHKFCSALSRRVRTSVNGENASLSDLTPMELAMLAYHLADETNWQGFAKPSRPFQPRLLSASNQAMLKEVAWRVQENTEPMNFVESDFALIAEAEELLRIHAPATYAHLEKWISGYCKLDNAIFRSASLPHAFGCIFFGNGLWESTAAQAAVSIVHEMAHQELFLINLVDRLVLGEADFKLVHAPLQGRLRPTIGRLHSLHALYRMVEFEHVVGIDPSRHVEQLLATADTFGPNDLTDFGMNLVNAVVKRTLATINLKVAVSV